MIIRKLALAAVAAVALMTAPAMAEDPIKIGVAGPMTGDYATFGEQMKRGAEMAVKDINAAGGVLGRQLELVSGDDACDPKQATSVAEQMAADKVALVAGHFCSGSSIPASHVYSENDILQISPASTNPKLTDEAEGENIFRVCGRDDQQGQVAAAYITAHYPGQKIAVVHDKQAYSQGLAEAVIKNLAAAGVTPALTDTIKPGEDNYAAFVTKLKQAQIDVLYYGGYHSEAALITRQMHEQGMKTVLISGDAMATEEYGKIAGAAGEGTLFTFGPDPRKRDEAKALVEQFKAGGWDPEGYTLYTYAAVQAWAQAAAKSGTTDTDKVAAALRAEGAAFDTVLGKLSFDAKGDRTTADYVFYGFDKDGKYAELPAEPAAK